MPLNEQNQSREQLIQGIDNYRPNLPPLFDAYVQLDSEDRVAALNTEEYLAAVRAAGKAAQAEELSGEQRAFVPALSRAEQDTLNGDAYAYMGMPRIRQELTQVYADRFSLRPEMAEDYATRAQAMGLSALRLLLTGATMAPRISATRTFLSERYAILQICLGEGDPEAPPRQMLPSGNLLEARGRLGEHMFWNLPCADLVRLPPSQRDDAVRALGSEVFRLCALLLKYRTHPYLRSDATAQEYSERFADCLLQTPVAVLERATERYPAYAGQLTGMFIENPQTFASQYEAVIEERRALHAASVQAGMRKAGLKADQESQQRIARQQRAQQEELDGLLLDPEVKPDLANLTPGAVVPLTGEGVILTRQDMLSLVEKHMHLAGLALWKRASSDEEHPPVAPIEFEGWTGDDVNVGMLLSKEFYGRFENVWIGVLPADPEYVRSTYRRGIRRLDLNHFVRLCVAVDLRSSGGAFRTFTNMVDVTLCVRRIPTQKHQEIACLLRTPSHGARGSDYLRLAGRLRGLESLAYQLNNVKLGGLPGQGKRGKHS